MVTMTINMNDDELREGFIRVEKTEDMIKLGVLRTQWPHPHKPVEKWVTVKTLEQY